MRRLLILAATMLIAGLCSPAAPAGAEPGRLADFTFRLTSSSPDAPSGLFTRVFLHREHDRNAKPSPLRSAVIRGPAGLRFDTSAVTECTASDEEIRALGSEACPAESELAVGPFTAISGFGPPADPFEADNHVFNGPDQLIEIITQKGGSASPAHDRLTIEGSTLTAHPPKAVGGPPEGEMAVRSLEFRIPVRVAGGRSLIRTPPICPASGRWTTTATFAFADGTADSVSSRTPCRLSRGVPGLRLRVHPGRVSAGRWVRLRFRLSSGSRKCRARAIVRVNGRAVRANRRGRAALVTKFRRPGTRRARAAKRGCRPASTPITVVARRAAREGSR
jgi:hypothetical protein